MQVLRGGQFRRNTAAEDVFDEDCLCCRQHELTKTSLLPRIKERAVGGGAVLRSVNMVWRRGSIYYMFPTLI